MKVSLQLSSPHECGYFSNRTASTLYVQPAGKCSSEVYNELLVNGFRRSGRLIYRPHCRNCRACLPLRVDARAFSPSRSQKRVASRNRDILHRTLPPEFADVHFRLYKQYLTARHRGGGMEKHTRIDYFESMVVSDVNTVLVEFLLARRLVAVAVMDIVEDGLSAVYTFFDPVLSARRSLGSLVILRQIELARAMDLDWVYLGYWIEESGKMAYKSGFRPAQIFKGSRWETLQDECETD